MTMVNERAKRFIALLCSFTSPEVTDLASVSRDDPDRLEKFELYNECQMETDEIIKALGVAVNHFGFDPLEIIEALKEDKKGYENLVQLSYEWIDLWNSADSSRTDPRNLESTNLCGEIAKVIIAHDGFITNTHSFAGLDVSVYRMHRTNVQSATRLFSQVLREENRSVKALLDQRFGSGVVALPMI